MSQLARALALDPRKPLLLTFDAFGTLYNPRAQIGTIYADCARKHGLSGFTDAQIEVGIRQAFKHQRAIAPNYGAGTTSSSPYDWWAHVARRAFSDLNIEPRTFGILFDDLWHQFGSSQAYNLHPHALDLFSTLRLIRRERLNKGEYSTVKVGVISNSDPRVSGILNSLGIAVRTATTFESRSHARFVREHDKQDSGHNDTDHDIDFIITSYEVGSEKPAREIFEAARERAISLEATDTQDLSTLQCLHVGDDIKEDHAGAINAGWKGILVGSHQKPLGFSGLAATSGLSDIEAFIAELYAMPTSMT